MSAFWLVLLVGALRVAFSQTPAKGADTQPRFEVVSIKRTGSSPSNAVDRPDGGLTRTNWYVFTLIAEAHPPIRRDDILGLPAWAKSDGYDIKATSTLTRATRADRASMLRAMLADRFKLAAHFEKRERDVYELVLSRRDGRLGSGLKPIDVDCDRLSEERVASVPFDPTAPSAPCTYRAGRGLLEGTGTMDDLTGALRLANLGRMIVNRTNLSGSYAFRMNFDLLALSSRRLESALDVSASVFSALQDELGLKLQPARVAVDTLIVDHLERPTED